VGRKKPCPGRVRDKQLRPEAGLLWFGSSHSKRGAALTQGLRARVKIALIRISAEGNKYALEVIQYSAGGRVARNAHTR